MTCAAIKPKSYRETLGICYGIWSKTNSSIIWRMHHTHSQKPCLFFTGFGSITDKIFGWCEQCINSIPLLDIFIIMMYNHLQKKRCIHLWEDMITFVGRDYDVCRWFGWPLQILVLPKSPYAQWLFFRLYGSLNEIISPLKTKLSGYFKLQRHTVPWYGWTCIVTTLLIIGYMKTNATN